MNKNKTDKIVVNLTKCFGIVLLVGIIIWAATYFLKGYHYEQTNDAQVDAYLSPVNAKVGGYISKIYYKDNQLEKRCCGSRTHERTGQITRPGCKRRNAT